MADSNVDTDGNQHGCISRLTLLVKSKHISNAKRDVINWKCDSVHCILMPVLKLLVARHQTQGLSGEFSMMHSCVFSPYMSCNG